MDQNQNNNNAARNEGPKVYLNNAFSLGMIQEPASIEILAIDISFVRGALRGGAVSNVGHASAAEMFSKILEMPVALNRVTTKLGSGDILIVGQYQGPRLPEGAIDLPEGATIKWLMVTVW